MALYAIADLHLSLGEDKPMDIFSGWNDYVARLKNNWEALVTPDDTVVIAGDISWAMKLEQTYTDFKFINDLPGKKIFIKGNHDYWWGTKSKTDAYLAQNKLDSISILFNNSYAVGDLAVCGTRGWLLENESQNDIKVLNREVGRLTASIQSAIKTGKEPVAFLHYPPVFGNSKCDEILNILKRYGVKKCFYGHIHGRVNMRSAVEGIYENIDFKLISCDRLSFVPLLVR